LTSKFRAGNLCTDLHQLIPPCADNDWVLRIRAESYARNPLGMTLVSDGEFAVAESIPELDSPVA